MAEAYKYWAFISYSHQDRAWGDWLHKTLETYRVPRRLIGRESRDGQVPARLYPVFRDRDELPSSANLGDVLNESLRQSRYQIVICSPRSAASRWVNEEIKYFKSLGREDRVLCLIVDGEPNVFDIPGRDIEECFAPALRYRVDAQGQITDQPAEPIAADAREHADGKRGARIKLLSGLLGVGFDELFQRERQRQFWQRVQIGLAAAAFAGLCIGAWQWFEGERVAREREITIERLVENGRLELLAGQQARAAVYLNEAYRMGNDSVPVRFMLAQAMKPVEALTPVRVKHGGIAVYKSAFSPDGKRFVLNVLIKGAGQQQAIAKIYDSETGALLKELPEAPPLPVRVEFLPGGSHLLMTGYPDDNRSAPPDTRIWDMSTSERPIRIEGFNGQAGLPLHPDGSRLLISGESGLAIHDPRNGQLISALVSGRKVNAASFSPDGSHIALADARGEGQILNAASGRVVQRLQGIGDGITGLVFAPDGRRLYALGAYGDVSVWEVATGQMKLAFAADPLYINELQFDRVGHRYLTVGSEGYKIWSTGRGVLMFSLAKSLPPYASAALSADGNTLVTADFLYKAAEAWDVRSKRKAYSLDFHADGISSAAFDAQGRRLLLASRDGTAEIWRMPVTPLWQHESFEALPYSAQFDSTGERLVVGTGDSVQGGVVIFDAASGQSLRQMQGHTSAATAVLSPAEDRILTASLDGTAGLWDAATGARLAAMDHKQPAQAASFDPTGTRILTTTYTVTLNDEDAAGLWRADDARHIAWLPHEGTVLSATFSPSGDRVATTSTDHRVRLWSANDGSPLLNLSGHAGPVRSVVFDRDGKRLMSAGDDSTIRIWDSENGALQQVFSEPSLGRTTQAIFSPDERTVAIATLSGNICLWSPTTGKVQTLKGHQQQVEGLRYSPDGALLFSYGYDGTLRAWDALRGEELAIVASQVRAINSLDLDATSSRAAIAAWGQIVVADIALERRSAPAVAEILKCKSPWAIDRTTSALIAVDRSVGECRPAGQ